MKAKSVIKYKMSKVALSDSVIKNRKVIRALTKLMRKVPAWFKSYEYERRVTFSMTTEEQNVSHAKFPELFGVIRENYAIDLLPDFRKDIGTKYLLKTRSASYLYLKDFHFGDTISMKMFVTEVNDVGYTLVCLFLKGNEICTIGEQKIVYAGVNNMPQKMTPGMKFIYEAIKVTEEEILYGKDKLAEPDEERKVMAEATS